MNHVQGGKSGRLQPVAHIVIGCVLIAGLLYVLARDADRSAAPPRNRELVFEEWRAVADPDDRQHLAEEMIRDRHLIGLPREQVEVALGEPNGRRMSPGYGDPKYIVGPSGVDDMWLCIHVENGTVARAELRSD